MPTEAPRWKLIAVESDNNFVHVMDNLSKRSRTYFVPFVTNAVINDHILDVETLNSKVMRINLINGSRHLIF